MNKSKSEIAKFIADRRVVEVSVSGRGVMFAEMCDDYFAVTLSPDDADLFAKHIIDLAAQARDNDTPTPTQTASQTGYGAV